MFKKDANGLLLTKSTRKSMSTYYQTAVCQEKKKFIACAYLPCPTTKKFSIYDIGYYDDPRDAAYVAQTFNSRYNRHDCEEMLRNRKLKTVIKNFLATIRLPVWKYPPHGPNAVEIIDRKKGKSDEIKISLREAFFTIKRNLPPPSSYEYLYNMTKTYVYSGMALKDAAMKVAKEL